ncbi:E3 ubiquitin-protein ligase PRT6 isoform X1 [Coffea arabica]|uniref:E3 ubiquitin-protein ligase n=1 Tax=Coffea arabica TaxID=13443 RepID=A0A6P6T092_COFAR
MEIDSPTEAMDVSPGARILQRLAELGIPPEYVEGQQPGLVSYVKNSHFDMAELVSTILPTDKDALEALSEAESEETENRVGPTLKQILHESMVWLQWLMFKGDPGTALENLSQMNVDQRGVCGAVWGNNDIAYQCRTCEHDPTCAICVPCFQNGNHKDHDYSIIYTGGGCCDCGDITAWKREGFCSKHKGAEQIQPLPKEFADSMWPVLDSLLGYWKRRLICAESASEAKSDHVPELKKFAEELTSAVVELLLQFCKCSESLLCFISGRVFSSAGLLDVLVRVERFLVGGDVRKLYELLLKLLGEPHFKYEFAKVFLSYYPTVVAEAIKEYNDNIFKEYPLLPTFSVQIFTVPTLTPRLVKEMNLLPMLLECLGDIFISCAGEDGQLQITKWVKLYETTIRVVEDIRFVMSHSVVPIFVTRERRDISRMWMRLLGFVQGMNPQKRETGMHIEEENDNMHLPFLLGRSIANIHSLLVGGAFSASGHDGSEEETFLNTYKQEFEDQDSIRHAKVGRISQECSVSSMTGRNLFDHSSKVGDAKSDDFSLPSSVLWLTYECLRAIENWLEVDNTSGPLLSYLSPKLGNMSGNNFFALKRTLSKFRKNRYIFKSSIVPSSSSKLNSSGEVLGRQYSLPSRSGINMGVGRESCKSLGQEAGAGSSDDSPMDGECATELEALRVLSLSDWPDLAYDVSSEDISAHIPLHRLLSMVLQRSLRKCYCESTLQNVSRATFGDPSSTIHQDFFGHILGGCHPHGFSAFVMEHPLRIRVFCAQVRAGMWRRNGDAAILSCEWYRSVRCSEQGLELDLFLLQCCAALAPADHYVKRILERFGLSNYLWLNLERSSEHEPILVQEMLTLIIQIIQERRFCGLTNTECLQRELVYKLSIGDATHSQLVKSLPLEVSKIDKLQEILDTVAVYSNPSGMNQGMYKLRLPKWKELDLYHPRWNSRDLQVAEERYLRFCNVSAVTTQLPKWSKIYDPLSGIARIATCKTVLQIIRAVLFYAVFSDKSTALRAPYGVLLAALHLLSLALDVCSVQRESGEHSCYAGDVIPILEFAREEISTTKHRNQSLLSLLIMLMRIHEKEKVDNFIEAATSSLSSLCGNLIRKFAELEPGCFMKLQKLAPEVVNQLSQSISNADANVSGFASDNDKRKAKAREMQAAILEKMRAQQSKFLESIDTTIDNGAEDSECQKELCNSDVEFGSKDTEEVVCSLCHDLNSKSPLSFLVLLQKSRLLSFLDRGPLSWAQSVPSKREEVSTGESADNLSSPSSASSTSPLGSNSELLHLIQSAVDDFALDGRSSEINAFLKFIEAHFPSVRNIESPSNSNDHKERTASSIEMVEDHMYSLIQDAMHGKSLHINNYPAAGGNQERSTQCLLLGKYIASVYKETEDYPSVSESTHSSRQTDTRMVLPAYDGFGPSGCDGIYLSSCGHAVHQGCLDRYLSSLRERYTRRIVFEGGHIVDPDQGEFLCPVCRGLANSVLPALAKGSKKVPVSPVFSTANASYAVGLPASSCREVDVLQVQEALSLLQSAADVSGNSEILKSIPLQQFGRQRSNLESVFRVLCKLYFPGKDKISDSGRISQSLVLWDTLKYSIVSTEIAARSGKTSLSPTYGLNVLFGELKSSNGFILSLLLNIALGSRVKNSPSILLRLRGIQLFAKSISSGLSLDKFPAHNCHGEGNMRYILENSETDAQYPDTQLWKRASDPVLARDAFSSLMWTLFCLPSPFLSCEKSFVCLVHLFYVVTIAQAIIVCCRKQHFSITELGYKDCLITDICKFVGEHEIALQYFDSNYIDASYDIKDAIRSLSFPYFRRCALLWRLINSSASLPFSHGNDAPYGSSYVAGDLLDHQNNIIEFVGVEKLEKMFKIPPIDVVINDEISRSMALRWLHHFSKEFKIKGHCVLYSTPAVPFSLMVLPYLYQDLLERYIKQHCPDCGAALEEPALCLLCGKLCSPNWKPCCRESGCQTHAMGCGAGTGVFLLIRKTSILLQRSARQAPWPSPYLDAFGEEDKEMHRGKPLYLSEERYAALTHMVASHGLDRSSKVLRQTTIGSFFML